MSPDFQRLIADYLTTVAKRFTQLQREVEVPAPKSSVDWVGNAMKKKGTLSDGATYAKHGNGCLIEFEGGAVDFDFGDRGEFDGFDAWRLAEFVRASGGHYATLEEKQIKILLDGSITSGEIERRGSLYYLKKTEPIQSTTDNSGASPLRV